MNKSLLPLLLVLLVCFLAFCMAQPSNKDDWRRRYRSNWSFPIQNISDPEIIKASKYAVSEFDKTSTYHLEFIRVVNGTEVISQFLTERIWILRVEAKNCSQSGHTDFYETEVHNNYLRCTWFRPPPNCDYYELSFYGLWKLPAVRGSYLSGHK